MTQTQNLLPKAGNHQGAIKAIRWCLREAQALRRRSMLQFATEEIVLPPGGPFAGRRFDPLCQPFTALWFAALEEGWTRTAAVGPSQSGKTLLCFVITLLYHLFELCETVIVGLPMMEMAADKWNIDIKPVILRSRYRNLIPTVGGGSRGAKIIESICFKNGAVLKFMSGGGSDKKRAAYSARVLDITETDGMDEPGAKSREGDKISQMEARTLSWGDRARIYLECTASIPSGRIWQEYTQGTESRIVVCCPHCHGWVSPEREHFTGWQEAETIFEARAKGAFGCPDCGKPFSDEQRAAAARAARLLHRGQTITPAGNVQGEPPPVKTLGFRWSAFNNLFLSQAAIAELEWRAMQDPDEENAKKNILQKVWALPYESEITAETPLDARVLRQRIAAHHPRGLVPADTSALIMAIDVHKFWLFWLLIAFRRDGRALIVDYDASEVHSDSAEVERAILIALRELREFCDKGWAFATGGTMAPVQVWIDARYRGPAVYQACREFNPPGPAARYKAVLAYGTGAQQVRPYRQPKQLGKVVHYLGKEYHVARLSKLRVDEVAVNADYWKTTAQERLASPMDAPGAITLFDAPPKTHTKISRHFAAHAKIPEFKPGKGMETHWHVYSREDHWLACLYMALAAGHYAAERLIARPAKGPETEPRRRKLLTPDGRPFLLTER